PLTATPLAAELHVKAYTIISTNATATYELRAVSTPATALRAGGSGLVSIYNDLADGDLFGSREFTVADSDHTNVIQLNADCLAAITAANGGPLAFGCA